MSIESQGYDTLLAEYNEKLWKQKTEQFMKRNKSESYRALCQCTTPFACVAGCTPSTLSPFRLP